MLLLRHRGERAAASGYGPGKDGGKTVLDFDFIRSASAFANAQAGLDGLARFVSLAVPRACIFVGIYRSHPALELGLSAGAEAGHLVGLPGLHAAFAQSTTLFDRWSVQRRQRDRWQGELSVPHGRLGEYWSASPVWRPRPFRRVVLCQGSQPIAYFSAMLSSSEAWRRDERLALAAAYRKVSPALRLLGLSWRARTSPENQSVRWLQRGRAVLVLAENGTLLSGSPEARTWSAQDPELSALVTSLGKEGLSAFRPLHTRRFVVRTERSGSAEGVGWKLVYINPRDSLPQLSASSAALTAREKQLCAWLTRGHSNREIAAQMGVAASTVKTMLERLYEKQGVRGRVSLVQRLLSADQRIVDTGADP